MGLIEGDTRSLDYGSDKSRLRRFTACGPAVPYVCINRSNHATDGRESTNHTFPRA